MIHDLQKLGSHPVGGGGFADIWQGELLGRTVALKVLRLFGQTDITEQIRQARIIL